MEIHTTNHTRRPDNSTHRTRCEHKDTKDFKVIQAGTDSGITLQARNHKFVLDVSLSREETDLLIKSLLKK
jgi:hypothetical protein